MSYTRDKGLILKLYLSGAKPIEFKNVGIDVYEGLKRDIVSGRRFIELSTVIQDEALAESSSRSKMFFIPTGNIQEITLEETASPEKERRN